jgi:hypothetical protein
VVSIHFDAVVADDGLAMNHEIGATVGAHVANGLVPPSSDRSLFSRAVARPFYGLGPALLVAGLTAALLFPVFFAS